MTQLKKVVIAFGSNLGDREVHINDALEILGKIIEIKAVSSIIETEPVGGPEQGKYLNGVLIGSTELPADDVMRRLLDIESDLGRVRTVKNGPRTIDLDLIDYEGAIIDTPLLTLPHPRAHERHFVIAPWAEIDPAASLPNRGTLQEIMKMNGWSI
jgi:2-amino-4-hydroxy-6-hydroxymethyldihydropteridine diphosphokinase